MKLLFFIGSLLLIASCADTQTAKPSVDKGSRKFVYLFGFIYGPVEKIVQSSANNVNTDKDISTLTFYDNGKKVSWSTNHNAFNSKMYFDAHFRIDSLIRFYDTSTSIFYKYPFYEDYVYYSVTNGKAHDTITEVMDSVKQSVSFILDGAVSSVNYFNKDSLLVRKTLESGSEERYEYDQFGNVTEQYITIPDAGIDNFKFEQMSYEYDSYGNWTKKVLKKMKPRGPGYTMTTTRVLTYKK